MAGGVLLLTGRAHKRPGDARAPEGGMARRAGAGGGVEGVAGAGTSGRGEVRSLTQRRKDARTQGRNVVDGQPTFASLRLCVFPPHWCLVHSTTVPHPAPEPLNSAGVSAAPR